MEVILLERVEKLGRIGDVVRVRPGYARNYLLPQKKAVRATDDNKTRFEAERVELEAQNAARRADAETVGGEVEGITVTLIRQAGESGQLYGSVNARDVANAVSESADLSVSRQQVSLLQPIKMIGLHDVAVALHPEVLITVRVNVARSEDEAELQARTGLPAGEAVLRAEEDAAEAEAKAKASENAPEDVAEDMFDAIEQEISGEGSGEGTGGDGISEEGDDGRSTPGPQDA